MANDDFKTRATRAVLDGLLVSLPALVAAVLGFVAAKLKRASEDTARVPARVNTRRQARRAKKARRN